MIYWQAWGEHWAFATGPPVVDAKKYLTHGKHNVNVVSRWTHNINRMVATAWFNGIGIESWENVWGSWAGKTPRAAQQIRVLAAMLRFAGGHEHGGTAQEDAPSSRALLRSALWEPYSPIVRCENATQAQVYASTWPSEGADGELYVSMVVVADRSASLGAGTVRASFELDSRVSSRSYHCYDAYRSVLPPNRPECPVPTHPPRRPAALHPHHPPRRSRRPALSHPHRPDPGCPAGLKYRCRALVQRQ